MIRNWYNQIPYLAFKTKMEITKYINWQQFTKGTCGKPNEQLFPRQLVIQLPKYLTNIIGKLKYKYGQQEQDTVRDLGKGSIKILGGGGGLNRFYGIPTSPSASVMAQKI